MLKCKVCGAKLDITMSSCPACGADVEMGRLTGILGVVCRSCDAYNEPGASTCASCGKPLGTKTTVATAMPVPAQAPVPLPAPTTGPAARTAAPARVPTSTRTPTSTSTSTSPPAPTAPPAAARRPPLAAAVPPRPVAPSLGQPGAPVVRAYPRPAILRPPSAPDTPGPLVAICPTCGAEAGRGEFCARCGKPLGLRGAQLLAAGSPAANERTATRIFGAPEPGQAKLVLERGEGLDGATFRLNSAEAGAGRSKGAVLFPSDACLAPLHATFFYRGGALHVRDEGAPGGVFVRLRGLTVPLEPGDLFAVGDRLLRFAGPLPPPTASAPDGTKRLGSPRPRGAAVLIEECLEGGGCGRVYLRPGPSVTVGRTGCSVNLGDDPYLSHVHAEILVEEDGKARLRDLGSANGTFVGLRPRSERALRDGDAVRMGREVLRVSIA